MYVPKRPGLAPTVWWNRRTAPPFPLSTSALHWTANGRQAMGLAVSAVGRVLVPAFICRSVPHAIEALGKAVEFYGVRDDLTVDGDSLLREADGRKAVVWVHYFGFPLQLELLETLRSRGNLLVVEDCAHAFLSQAGDRPLGTFGHCGVFSFRKTVPVAEGGGLVVNASMSIPRNGGPPSYLRALKGTIDLMMSDVELRMGCRLRSLRKAVRARKAFTFTPNGGNTAAGTISPLTRYLLTRFDSQAIRQSRRANYLRLLQVLEGLRGVQTVFPILPDGVCPMAFPLWVDDRERLQAALLRAGVEAYPWPDLPDGLDPMLFRGVYRMAHRLLLLPLHQDLNGRHLRWIEQAVKTATDNARGNYHGA